MAVVLRNGVVLDDPLAIALRFAEAEYTYDVATASRPSTFGEPDLRLANRGGARISATEIAAILERRPGIERALRTIPPETSLAARAVPWQPLERLFSQFADLHGVGFAKMTKTLHKKRPALIPMLDSVVQTYLADDDLGKHAPFGERAVGFVRGYKRDLDRYRPEVRTVQRELASRGYTLSEVRILDALIWSAAVDFTPARSS